MRREEMEQQLVGYLYGELTVGEREEVEREIERNPEWAEVLEDLRRASGLLRRWEDEAPVVRHLVSGAPAGGARRALRLRRTTLLSAAAGIAAALLLIAFNLEVGVADGRFQLSLGRERASLPYSAQAPGTPLDLEAAGAGPFVTEDDFLRSQAELIRFVAALLEESEDRQTDRFVTALADYAREADTRREGELALMDRRLGAVESGARDLFERVSADFPLTEIRAREGDER